jgi:hypothetical protein
LKRKLRKSDGTDFEVAARIENVPFAVQANFIAQVANFAMKKYQLKYPNANEIEALKK